MLVLSRKKDESVVLTMPDGRRITVMLIELRGDKCRLGFDAPKDIAVHRSEVQAAVDRGAVERKVVTP